MSKKRVSPVRKRRKRKLVLFIIEIIVFLVLLLALFFWLKLQKINHTSLDEEALGAVDSELLTGYTNIALFGLDNRSMGNLSSGNSDVIMVMSIDNSSGEINLVSVYRDTFLAQSESDSDTSYSYRKANAAFSNGGVEEAIRMLNTNLDLNITDYVTVDFQALIDAIDIVGGVEITLTDSEVSLINTYIDELEEWTGGSSTHISSAGTYTLDGIQATAYCRIRHTGNGDFGRAQRQRKVLAGLFSKVKSSGLVTANKVIDAVLPEVETSLTSTEIVALATKVIGYDIGNTSGFPFDLVTGSYTGVGSIDIPCTLESNVTELYSFLFGVDDYTPSETVQEISSYIENYTGKSESDAVDYGIEDDELSTSDDSSDE